MAEMAPEAMDFLSASVRRLRTILEADLARQLERRYRWAVPAARAGLDEQRLTERKRLEQWFGERVRARASAHVESSAEALRQVRSAAESEIAAQTLLRLLLLRQLEASGISRPAVLSGGWSSKGYLEFRDFAPGLTDTLEDDGFEGLGLLLKIVFDELATDLPGLYGEKPLERFFFVSPAALREVVAVLNAPELSSAWLDDTLLGWVYQFWNDPRREAIDERVGPRGKVSSHEIASKTQLFTERYMVDWLLQNSIGRIAESMRLSRATEGEQEPWVTQAPLFVAAAAPVAPVGLPRNLTELTVLDPACGSGHFLAGAFDLLVPLYRAEAEASGVELSNRQIAHSILRFNLHGVDIDSRAVQVAAAVLYLKARRLTSGETHLRPAGDDMSLPPMNLVATVFDLDGLALDDPALARLSPRVRGGRSSLVEMVTTLRHVGLRGSLMRFGPDSASLALEQSLDLSSQLARVSAVDARAGDLGVRFDGDQLAAGLRLRKLLVEGRYDVVAFNPPYLAVAKIGLPETVLREAFGQHTDLFAAFVERALELCKPTGLIAFVAVSNWMFLSSFKDTRERILAGHILLLADVGKGAFRRASKLIQSAMVVASPTSQPGAVSLAARVGSRDLIDSAQTEQIATELRDPTRYVPFQAEVFSRIEGAPLVFWIDPTFMQRYAELPKVGEVAEGLGGIATTNNERFLRAVWEVPTELARQAESAASTHTGRYLPYLKGAEGRSWIEPYRWLLRMDRAGLELRVLIPNIRLHTPSELGVAYTTIGHNFGTRLHSVASVRDVSGASVFPKGSVTAADLVCALNRTVVRDLASALNPTVNFQLGDVRRLPFDRVPEAAAIVAQLRAAFEQHEQSSELSLKYLGPGPSSWEAAQAWAQRAVDSQAQEPLPVYAPAPEAPVAQAGIAFAFGVALGRFDAAGQGIVDSSRAAGMPYGMLFLSSRESGDQTDNLATEPCQQLRAAWDARPLAAGGLNKYLRTQFFEFHRKTYENRPIYLPLSSAKKSFVAYVLVHRFTSETLSVLLADHLVPEKRRLEGALEDLRRAHAETVLEQSERRFAELQKLVLELDAFIQLVTEMAEKGPPVPDSKTPPREVDARCVFELDDGILVNCAALWPLLDAQWKDPKQWWKDLARSNLRKDYDWSHVARRYFPSRVRAKCMQDPSLAVAHGCFWELHPEAAYAWELRLQAELGRDFILDEPGAEAARTRLLTERPKAAKHVEASEQKRRHRKAI